MADIKSIKNRSLNVCKPLLNLIKMSKVVSIQNVVKIQVTKPKSNSSNCIKIKKKGNVRWGRKAI